MTVSDGRWIYYDGIGMFTTSIGQWYTMAKAVTWLSLPRFGAETRSGISALGQSQMLVSRYVKMLAPRAVETPEIRKMNEDDAKC